MISDSLNATEAECAAGRTAPRVSLSDIENAIARTIFATGSDIETAALDHNRAPSSLGVLTVCLVEMKNGFTIIGKSAPASPANFDADLGRKLAYEDAVRQIWPLMGFALRDKLAGA